MRLEQIHVTPVGYRLLAPLGTQAQTLRQRAGLRVRLENERGKMGIGEALPLETSGTETLVECQTALERLAVTLHGQDQPWDDLLDAVDDSAPETPAARCAFDCAVHDLQARIQGVSVARLLGARPSRRVPVNAVLGSSEAETTLRGVRAAYGRGYRTIKLKVGRWAPHEEIERLRAVRHDARARGLAFRLRIDANGSWSLAQALEIFEALHPLEIELVEQPIAAGDLAGLERLSADSPIPVALDETLAFEEGRAAARGGKLGTIAVLKPMVLGGARACARFAASTPMRCLVTTTFEGVAGTALATHLAAAIGEPGLACGLASSDVLDHPFPPGLIPRHGSLEVHTGPGLGYGSGP